MTTFYFYQTFTDEISMIETVDTVVPTALLSGGAVGISLLSIGLRQNLSSWRFYSCRFVFVSSDLVWDLDLRLCSSSWLYIIF